MQQIVYPNERRQITVPSGSKIAVFTNGVATLSQLYVYDQAPDAIGQIARIVNEQYVSSAFSVATTVYVESNTTAAFYAVGTAPVVGSNYDTQIQAAPVAVNVTGAISSTAMLGGLVTSTTAAAVEGTVPAGSVLDAASSFAINDSFDWSVIATGANEFTLIAATGHTLVGDEVVATATSGTFRTRKTAADTFVTYRIA